MYQPGKVPSTGGQHTLIHERNLALVAHEAILSCDRSVTSDLLTYEHQRRVCRLLLIANDLLDAPPLARPSHSLHVRRDVALSFVRNSQFNRYFRPMPLTLLTLARQRILFVEHLLNHFDAREAFAEATSGVSLERYFQILSLFMTHVFGAMKEEGTQWIALDSLLRNVHVTQRAEADLILQRWVRTPQEYENSWRDWQASAPGTVSEPGFDFIPLRTTPLIEGRPREAICPVLPFLLPKAVDEPYFILCDHLGATDPKRLQQFQDALGRAYEDYAHTLVERIAPLDQAGQWTPDPRPSVRDRAIRPR